MELIKDIIKIDSRIDFGKYQTFIESEAVVPDIKSDVYEIIDTQGYIALSKIEVSDGKLVCRGFLNYNVIYIADDKTTLSNINGKVDINEVVEKDNIVQDMEYMLYPEIEHIDCTILNERKINFPFQKEFVKIKESVVLYWTGSFLLPEIIVLFLCLWYRRIEKHQW